MMSEQQNTLLVKQAYESFKHADMPALLSLCSDDIDWELPEMENVPFAGKRHGREQVAQFFSALAEAQEVQQFDPEEFIAQGDKVVVLGHEAWRVKATGRMVEDDWTHVFTLHDGKIVKFHEYLDTAAAVAAYQKH
jgi:ketosteroid isomerase-like protein